MDSTPNLEQMFEIEEVGTTRGGVILKVSSATTKPKLIVEDDFGKVTVTLNLRDISSIYVLDEQTVRIRKSGAMLFKLVVSFKNSSFLEQFLDAICAIRPAMDKVISWKGNRHHPPNIKFDKKQHVHMGTTLSNDDDFADSTESTASNEIEVDREASPDVAVGEQFAKRGPKTRRHRQSMIEDSDSDDDEKESDYGESEESNKLGEPEEEDSVVHHSQQKIKHTLERTLRHKRNNGEWKQLVVKRYNRFGQGESASFLLSLQRGLIQIISHVTGEMLGIYRFSELVGTIQHGYNALGLSLQIYTDGTALEEDDLVEIHPDALDDDVGDNTLTRLTGASHGGLRARSARFRARSKFSIARSTQYTHSQTKRTMVENLIFESHDDLRFISKSLKKALIGKMKVEMRRTLNNTACSIDFQGGWSIFRGGFERKRGLRTIAMNPFLGHIYLFKATAGEIITPRSRQKLGVQIVYPQQLTVKIVPKHLTRVQVDFQGIHLVSVAETSPTEIFLNGEGSFDSVDAGIQSTDENHRNDWKFVCLEKNSVLEPSSSRGSQTSPSSSRHHRSDSEGDVEFFRFSFDCRSIEEANRFMSILNSLREASEQKVMQESQTRSHGNPVFLIKRNPRSLKNVEAPCIDVKNASLLQQHAWSSIGQEWFTSDENIFIGTFNVGDAAAPRNLDTLSDWIPRSTDARSYKIIAIGLQEVSSKFDEWQKAITAYLGDTYQRAISVRMWEVVLLVYVHLDELHNINSYTAGSVKTGLRLGVGGVQLGNKGGVGIGFRWRDVPVCFISAHLSAQQHKVSERNLNYTQIMSKLHLQGTAARIDAFPLEPTLCFEHIFFFGDLNYRVELDFKQAERAVTHKNYNLLHTHDQLQHQLSEGTAFYGFKTPLPEFAPTYRWKRGRRELSNKREQPPSYTDRVLWHSHPGSKKAIVINRYFCADSIMISDHRPVGSDFTIALRHEYTWPFHPLTFPDARDKGSLEADAPSRSFAGPGISLRRLAERVSKRKGGLRAPALLRSFSPANLQQHHHHNQTPHFQESSPHQSQPTEEPAPRPFALHLEDDGGWTSKNGDFFVSPRDAMNLGAPRIKLQNVVVSLDAPEDGTQLPTWVSLCIASPILHQVEWSVAAAGTELSPDSRKRGKMVQRFAYQGTGAFQDLYYAFDPQIGMPTLKPTVFDPIYLKSQHLTIQVTQPSGKDEESLSLHHILLSSKGPEEMAEMTSSLVRSRHQPGMFGQTSIPLRHVVQAVGTMIDRYGLKNWTAKRSPTVSFSEAIIRGGLQVGRIMGEICILPPTEDARQIARRIPDHIPSPASEEAVFGSLDLRPIIRQGFIQVKYRKSYTRVSTRVFLTLHEDGRAFILSRAQRSRKLTRPSHNILAVLDMRHVKIDEHQESSFVLSECRPLGPDSLGLVTMIWAVDTRAEKMTWIEALESVRSEEPFPEEPEESEAQLTLFNKYNATLMAEPETPERIAEMPNYARKMSVQERRKKSSIFRRKSRASDAMHATAAYSIRPPPPPPPPLEEDDYLSKASMSSTPPPPADITDRRSSKYSLNSNVAEVPGEIHYENVAHDASIFNLDSQNKPQAGLSRTESVDSAAAVLTLAVAAVAHGPQRQPDEFDEDGYPRAPPPPPSPSASSSRSEHLSSESKRHSRNRFPGNRSRDSDDDSEEDSVTSSSQGNTRWTTTSIPPPSVASSQR